MAKGKTGFVGFLAFGAMIITAVVVLLTSFDLNLGSVGTVLQAVKDIALVIVVLFVAYDFASKQEKLWRIIFWILAVITIISLVSGYGYNFAN